MAEKKKVAIIGNGGRSVSYGEVYAKTEDVEVVALCDIVPENTLLMAKMSGLDNYKSYTRWQDVLKYHPDLDGVCVITPNNTHREIVMPFIERGLAVALEKPITTTMTDTEDILKAAKKYETRMLIGFVLRSAPFYKKVHEVLEEGVIGNALSIQADELASFGVSSCICRSPWRRYQETSGGSMMEKSSHDMDLINWFSSSRPVSVNSYGGNLLFRPNPLFPKYCRNCPQEKCKYQSKPEFSLAAQDSVLHDFMQHTIAEQNCIYNVEKDVADNQSVQIEYANGMIANFMLAFNCSGPRSARNIHIVGTKGRIFGNVEENKLYVFINEDGKLETHDIKVEGGHSGGNSGHAFELVKMMRSPSYKPDQDAYAGYLSNAICIAADVSRAEGKRINFRYDQDGFIDFV
ncbi:MAG: Gfo/Idh/MocA family oxidoreductase [Lentisphaeria bacterium]|nr:Gfo/Idh/MocA family oxidoreductase [Lentisphaeria bacterium]